jgi:PAS domain S-box-containing protein
MTIDPSTGLGMVAEATPPPRTGRKHAPATSSPLASGDAHRADRYDPGLSNLVLGLRLLALAVVAGSGTLLPIGAASRPGLIAGILAGAAVGALQYLAARAGRRGFGEALVPVQVASWTWLVHVSGDQHSPLFVGYLLEVALAGAAYSRRGCSIAALGGFAAYLMVGLRINPPLVASTLATVGGFLAVGTVLTWLLIGAIEGQRRRLALYHSALRARADTVGEELRLLGDYMSGALVSLDDLGRVVSVNPAAAQLLGIEAQPALGRPWQEIVRADSEGVRAIVATLSEGRAQRGLTMTLRRADGREIGVGAELWVSPSPEGRRTYLLARESTGAPAESDPLRRLGEAVACVAHQIKNSLHAMQGFAGEIARDPEGSADRSSAEHLLCVVKSLSALSDDVLAMAGASRPLTETVQLSELLESATMLTRLAPGRVVTQTCNGDLRVRAHRGQLVHALYNLIDNACRVSPAGEPVHIGARREGDRVAIEIADRGPGIPSAIADGAGPALSKAGSGFGLLAVRRFVEANGGTLRFEPRPGGGTLCRVAFRAEPDLAPQPDA